MIKEFNIKKCMTCDKNESVLNLVAKMKKRKEKMVIVLNRGNPVGIITLSDIVFKGIASGKDLKKICAYEISSKDIYHLDEKEDECRAYIYMFTHNHLFCIITSKGKFKGVLNLSELIKKHAADYCNAQKKKS
jgi:signal-transduction protein with cAMP-binding, CBS, and nucleotidyltransferase domain